jgi:hypothetical protein
MPYFTDRNQGPIARTETEIPEPVRRGLVSLIISRGKDDSFGLAFPWLCPDGEGVAGADTTDLRDVLAAHRLYDPFERQSALPSTFELLDLIEFSYERIARPIKGRYHSFYQHHHLSFDQTEGRAGFRNEVNTIFARNGIAFDLQESGEIERLAPPIIAEALAEAAFHSGDTILDQLLEKAEAKYLNRDLAVRRESLEALWDAFERLKTIEPGSDKRESMSRLLAKASAQPGFKARLEEEARTLTDVGNSFMIRHTEINKIPVVDDEHIDYLFHRLFALIRVLLKKSGRGG